MKRTTEKRFGTLFLLVGTCLFVPRVQTQNVYETPIGGLETVTLGDGSRVTLNTNTKIRVCSGRTQRRVDLEMGEAYFIVTKDPARPFSVFVADRYITATDTKFSVRRNAQDVQIVVTEGRVQMAEVGASAPTTVTTLPAGTVARAAGSEVLTERASGTELERMLSWREGFVEFHDTTLTDAVAEFNRYRAQQLSIADPEIASIRISGRFRSTNSDAFLWLLQQGFPVIAEERQGHIILRRHRP
jgi:transmembrane sensor